MRVSDIKARTGRTGRIYEMMTAAKKQDAQPPKPAVPQTPAPPPATPTTEAPTAPAPAAAVATTLGASKQQMSLAKLKEGWTAKNIDLSKLQAKVDGKYLNVQVDETWPLITIGPGGGINIPAIKSYTSPFDAAMDAKTLLAKQVARDAKPAAPVVVKVVANVVPDQAKAGEAVTPAQKKKQADAALEQKLQAQA
jgi:hypothetical protein